MNLVRLGHFFIPNNADNEDVGGSCQTALVVHVWSDELVNIVVWDGNGNASPHTSVPVAAVPNSDHASFHLAMDCPWHR